MPSVRAELIGLEIAASGAVLVRPSQPFRLASGNYSPIYVDCRRLISSVRFVGLFVACARAMLEDEKVDFDVIAGGETAGIPYAAFLGAGMSRPMVYVRKQAKEHGAGSQVEGTGVAGSRVLLVEDLVTDGASKIVFVDGLRAAGALVTDALVVLDRQQGGAGQLLSHGVSLRALTTIDVVLGTGEAGKIIPSDDVREARRYLTSPERWHSDRGLPFAATDRRTT